MVKSAIKALKKAKIQHNEIKNNMEDKVETVENGDHDKKKTPTFGKELRQSLICESAYITDLLGIVNFPKREDSDDDDGKIIQDH